MERPARLADLRARPVWRDLDAVERGHVVNVERGNRAAFAGIGRRYRATRARMCIRKRSAAERKSKIGIRQLYTRRTEIESATRGRRNDSSPCRPIRTGVRPVRPLTPRRVAWICAGLGVDFFAAAVISLRIGAYPISRDRYRQDAFQRSLGHWEADTQRVPVHRVRYAAAAHPAGNFGGRVAFDGGLRFSGAACEIRWPIRTCSAFRAARRWARFSA